MDGSTSTQAKKRRISCFSCFPGQDSTEAKRRNVNCFSCFSAEDSTEGKKRNMNCFPCFRVQDMTRAKKDSTHGKTRKVDCFSCFRTQDSTQPKKDATQGKAPKMNCFSGFPKMHSTHERTANTNCFLGFTTQEKSRSTQGKKRKMNCFSYYRTQEKKDSTQGKKRIRVRSYFSCYPTQGKIRRMKLRRRVKCPFKNKHRVPDQIQYEDVKKCKFNIKDQANNNLAVKIFTFKELATATKNFREECLLGEGGFGSVYKGKLKKTGEDVAVKQLNREGKQGNSEFIVEVMMLSHLCHPHLVNLVGYCADGDQRLLVYEYMSAGSLENHLLDLEPGKKSLDWCTRIKVALHAAKGLEYLHETNKPPIIYRDLKSSNILLDKDFNAKLSDFGLAKLGPVGEKTHVTSRVMGTLGYCAPEYQKTGKLTVKSDLYSYGVVLLELVTGRRAVDFSRESEELHLVRWVEPMIKHPHRYSELVDPLLEGNYPRADLSQVLAIASMCVNVDASVRPSTSDVVAALGSLVDDPIP